MTCVKLIAFGRLPSGPDLRRTAGAGASQKRSADDQAQSYRKLQIEPEVNCAPSSRKFHGTAMAKPPDYANSKFQRRSRYHSSLLKLKGLTSRCINSRMPHARHIIFSKVFKIKIVKPL